LINCAAAAWQQENKLVQFQKLFLEIIHIRMAVAVAALATSPAHCTIALCRTQCSLFLTFCSSSSAAKRAALSASDCSEALFEERGVVALLRGSLGKGEERRVRVSSLHLA
jgi:hypothetical protein